MAAFAGSKQLANRRDRAQSGLTARDYLRIAAEAGCTVKTVKRLLTDKDAKARETTKFCVFRATRKLGLAEAAGVR